MGKFILKEAKTGFMFNLTANNGEIIGTSEVYSSKEACLKGIDSVRLLAPKANVEDQTAGASAAADPKFEIFSDKAGEFRFRLKASNGEIILASEGYTTKDNCKNGIKSVVENAPGAEIVEEGE